MARSAKQIAAQKKAAKASAAARTRRGKAQGAKQTEAARMKAFQEKYAKETKAEHILWATRGAKSKVGKDLKPGKSTPVSERASAKNRAKVSDMMYKKLGITGGVGTKYGSRRMGTDGPEQLRRRARAGDAASQKEWAEYEKTRAKVRGTKVKKKLG